MTPAPALDLTTSLRGDLRNGRCHSKSQPMCKTNKTSNVECCDWLLGPCDPKGRFANVGIVGLVFGLENVCIHSYIYRQAGFVLGGFAQALLGVEGVMGDGECTMDPCCSPNFGLLQGHKDAEKFRNKGQTFWCTLGRRGGSLQRKKLGVDLVSLREAQTHQLFFLGRPIRAGVGRQCQVWGLCDWLGIPNAHIHGNVLQNLSHSPMAAVRLNQIHTIQSCSFRIPSHI